MQSMVIYTSDIQRQQGNELQPNARMIWFPQDYREDALHQGLDSLTPGDWLQLPTVCEESTLQMLHRMVTEYADRLGGVVLGSIGQLGMDWPVPMGAGSGIPVMNRRAAAMLLDMGCQFVTASP